MMISNLVSAASVLLLWCALEARAVPTNSLSPGLNMPLRVRSPIDGRNVDELGDIAKRLRDTAIHKYAKRSSNQKRSSGYNLCVLSSAPCRCVACADRSGVWQARRSRL